MTTEEIIKMAFELGQAISESKEVVELTMQQVKLTQNQEAYDLILRYQEAQKQLENKAHDGLLITPAEENHISILEQQLNSNEMIKNLMQAQENLDRLMQGVYYAINQAITGGNNCASGCASCGGGCQI